MLFYLPLYLSCNKGPDDLTAWSSYLQLKSLMLPSLLKVVQMLLKLRELLLEVDFKCHVTPLESIREL